MKEFFYAYVCRQCRRAVSFFGLGDDLLCEHCRNKNRNKYLSKKGGKK